MSDGLPSFAPTPPVSRSGHTARRRVRRSTIACHAVGAMLIVLGLGCVVFSVARDASHDQGREALSAQYRDDAARRDLLETAVSRMPDDDNATRWPALAEQAGQAVAERQNGLVAATLEPDITGVPEFKADAAGLPTDTRLSDEERLDIARQAQADDYAQLRRELIPFLPASDGFDAADAWHRMLGIDPAPGLEWSYVSANAIGDPSDGVVAIDAAWELRDTASGARFALVTADWSPHARAFTNVALYRLDADGGE